MFFTSLWCKTYQTKYFLWSNQESAAGSNSFSKSYIEKGKGMCSPFQLQKVMENNFQGDLADIFLGSSTSSGESSSTIIADGWQFPSHPINYLASGVEEPFGDPFCNLRDPLFHDIYMMPIEDNNNNSTSLEEAEIKRGNNIFSRMLQISPTTKSPCDSPMAAAVTCSSPFVANDAIISPNSSKTRLVENSRLQLQISSPPNTAIKRRKCQAKKVVCIPAPAPANSRQGGEVVPSDLWAWRKYGQKPIKGSPYPRGYYRCSSSKGCSARKQVERSRTDPNMLVITYTSEHNHPWPTQRNALAGSTRSQPTNSKHTSKSPTNTSFKEDEKKESDINDKNTSSIVAQVNLKVKEEVALEDLHGHHQQLVKMHDVEFSKGIQDSYQPVLPDSSNQCHEDFFSDLVELEADPLNLLFAKTLSGDINEVGQKKAIDAFNLYEWSGNSNKDGNTTSNNKGQADA